MTPIYLNIYRASAIPRYFHYEKTTESSSPGNADKRENHSTEMLVLKASRNNYKATKEL